MIEEFGFAGFHHGNFIRDTANMREEVAHPNTTLAVPFELACGAQQLVSLLERAVHKGKPFAFDKGFRDVLAVPFGQFGLPVE